MVWLIALTVIFIGLIMVAFIPVCLRFRYDQLGFALSLLLGPIRIRLYPNKGKKRAGKDKADKKKKSDKDKQSVKGGDIKIFLPLIQTALSFLNNLRRKIYITNLKLLLTIGNSDPCDLSIQLGYGWAILGNTLPLVEQIFRIKKRDLMIVPDYTAERITVFVAADIRICLWRLLYITIRYGIIALKQYLDIKNSNKAVQNNESKSS